MEELRAKRGFICDMDGVIYHGDKLLPGVKEFVSWLQKENKQYLFLTNSSERSPRELCQKLRRMELDVDVYLGNDHLDAADHEHHPAAVPVDDPRGHG